MLNDFLQLQGLFEFLKFCHEAFASIVRSNHEQFKMIKLVICTLILIFRIKKTNRNLPTLPVYLVLNSRLCKIRLVLTSKGKRIQRGSMPLGLHYLLCTQVACPVPTYLLHTTPLLLRPLKYIRPDNLLKSKSKCLFQCKSNLPIHASNF